VQDDEFLRLQGLPGHINLPRFSIRSTQTSLYEKDGSGGRLWWPRLWLSCQSILDSFREISDIARDTRARDL
jgi:uncharacterized protein HemX